MYINKIFKTLLGIIIFILISGIIYEQIMRYYTHKKYAPKGEFFAINDSKIHAVVKGKSKSKPAVVFLAGYYPTGASSLIWSTIQSEVSKHTMTISYDRSGILWSTKGKEITIASTIEDLYQLLKEIDGNGPYILVGHSISGMTIRAFAKEYPDIIEGLVLIDSSHPEAQNKIPSEILGTPKDRNYHWISFLSSIGYIRLVDSYTYSSTSKKHSINRISNALFPEKIISILKSKELKYLWAKKIREQQSFGNLPIKIIVASGEKVINQFSLREQGEKFNKIWRELQQDMLSLSSKSELIIAKDSGHYIPLEDPDLITRSIIKLLYEIEAENFIDIDNI